MRSPYRDLEKASPSSSHSTFADGCVIASLLAVWSAFVAHLIRAAHTEQLAITDALMAFVLVGVSALLFGATNHGKERIL